MLGSGKKYTKMTNKKATMTGQKKQNHSRYHGNSRFCGVLRRKDGYRPTTAVLYNKSIVYLRP